MQENQEKITKRFCEKNRREGTPLLFFPQHESEADLIQQHLFKMGYPWHTTRGDSFDLQESELCIKLKMILLNGKIFVNPQSTHLVNGLLCTAEQLKENYVAPTTTDTAKGMALVTTKGAKDGASEQEAVEEVDEIAELEKKIAEAGMTEEARVKCEKELKKLGNMKPDAAEYEKIQSYLEKMVLFPWTERSEIEQDLKKVRAVLDASHYGRDDVKTRIVEDAAVQKRTDKPSGAILCLVGEPGVGKTSIGQGIADATGRKFVRISLGGIEDEAEIRGHRRTYVDSAEGRIMQAMLEAGTINPIIMLDEIDKMGGKAGSKGGPAAAVLEVLDPKQNHSFFDRYTGVKYDLSNAMFLCTANVLEDISGPLRDRMEVMYLSGYPDEEKIEIAKNYLIPGQREENKLTEAEFSVTDAALAKLIDGYTYEAGVRKLEEQIGNLARKAVVQLEQGDVKSVTITPENLEQYAGPKKVKREIVDPTPRVGHVNGLAVTGATGMVLEIEATMYADPKGGIEATGNLKETIEESVRYSDAWAKANAHELGIPKEVYLNNTLHIKVSKGGTPVDGPSAGLAMATLETSVRTGIPIRGDVAMTGEISVRGESGPIGGLQEKLDGAFKAGIKTVLIPVANLKDFEDPKFPAKLKENLEIMPDGNAENLADVPEGKMRVIPVQNEWEVLHHALTEMPKPLAAADEKLTGENIAGQFNDAAAFKAAVAEAVAGLLQTAFQATAPANDDTARPAPAASRRPTVTNRTPAGAP